MIHSQSQLPIKLKRIQLFTSRRTVTLVLLMLVSLVPLFAAPQAELWPRWEAHNPNSTQVVDHSAWDRFLQQYLVTNDPSGVHLFPYGQVSPADRAILNNYIRSLESTQVSGLNKDEQLAYWVNMYNAVTIQLILNNYPLNSIRNIRRPWDTALVRIEGEQLTLNDIEHRILRPIWKDPRIHYVVNCASIGCPNLQPRAYTSTNWPELFDLAARQFINHPRGVNFSGSRPVFSSIFDWYQVDFGGNIQGVVTHMLNYAEGPTAVALNQFAQSNYGRVRYEYDWNLNRK